MEFLMNIGMMIRVIATYVFFYILIPMLIIRFQPETDKMLDKIFISFIGMVFTTIVVIHLLATCMLYDTISLIIAYVFVLVFIFNRKHKGDRLVRRNLGERAMSKLLKLADGKEGFRKGTEKYMRERFHARMSKLKVGFTGANTDLLFGVLAFLVLLAAAAYRFQNPIMHAAFSHIDTYGDLISIKYVGLSDMYRNGVYPRGLHAAYSALAKLFFIDPYWLCRYMGPVNGTLIVLSVYYFVVRITKNRAAGLISLVIYGLVNSELFPSIMFRQESTVPQEFALIFVLPGLYFLYLYITEKQKRSLYIFLQCLTITLFVHTYIAFFMIVLAAIMMIGWLLFCRPKFMVFLQAVGLSASTGVVAFLPMGVGLLFGYKFQQSSIEMLQISLNYRDILRVLLQSFRQFFETNNPFLLAVFPAAGIILLGILVYREKEKAVLGLTVLLGAVGMFFVYRVPDILQGVTLPELLGQSRTGVLFALILVPLYALGFYYCEKFVSSILRNKLQKGVMFLFRGIAIALCILIMIRFPYNLLYHGTEEYDSAAQQYLGIKRKFPILNWTIVGPHEQFAQALGFGWQVQSYDFVWDYTLAEVQNPSFSFSDTTNTLVIPTEHIFVYVETTPLKYGMKIGAEERNKTLPLLGDDAFMEYYKTTATRAIMEAKMLQIMEAYRTTHDNVEIYREDDNLRIYHITQKEPNQAALNGTFGQFSK